MVASRWSFALKAVAMVATASCVRENLGDMEGSVQHGAIASGHGTVLRSATSPSAAAATGAASSFSEVDAAAAVAECLRLERLLRSRSRVGKRSDAAARAKAAAVFLEAAARAAAGREAAAGPWSYKGVGGSTPLQCDGKTYDGPVDGLGAGAHGVAVLMHRGTKKGPQVVVKLVKSELNLKEENLNHECDVSKVTEAAKVQNVVVCEASCLLDGRPMIVVSPFKSKAKNFIGPIRPTYFESAAAAESAIRLTFTTGFAMLEAGVANIDQGHNILYGKDGSLLFIDMGLAVIVNKLVGVMRTFHVERFIKQLVQKLPADWWKDGTADKILVGLKIPKSPASLKDLDFEKMVQKEIKLARSGETFGVAKFKLSTPTPMPTPMDFGSFELKPWTQPTESGGGVSGGGLFDGDGLYGTDEKAVS